MSLSEAGVPSVAVHALTMRQAGGQSGASGRRSPRTLMVADRVAAEHPNILGTLEDRAQGSLPGNDVVRGSSRCGALSVMCPGRRAVS